MRNLNRKEASKIRKNQRNKDRLKTWHNVNFIDMNSLTYDGDEDEDNKYEDAEWQICYNQVIKNRINNNIICLCCNSLFCDHFDEIKETHKMIKQKHQEKIQNTIQTFSCYGSE
jgi:hypothetical protein